MRTDQRQPIVEYVDGSAVFRGYLPRHARLRDFVELIWRVSGEPDVASERVLPNGALELIVNLGPAHVVHERHGDTTFRRAWIAGLQRGPLDIGMTSRVSELVGIRFRPGGALPMIGTPLRELTDRVVELEGKGTEDIRELRDRMLEVGHQWRVPEPTN